MLGLDTADPVDPCLPFTIGGVKADFKPAPPDPTGLPPEVEQLFPAPPGQRWTQFESTVEFPSTDGMSEAKGEFTFEFHAACSAIQGNPIAVWLSDNTDDLYGYQVTDLFMEGNFAGQFGGVAEYGLGLGGANVAGLYSFSMPSIGETLVFQAENFNGSGTGLLFITGGELALPLLGGTLLVDLSSLILNQPFAVANGRGKTCAPIPPNPALVGFTAFGQAAMVDPSQPAGVALSNGVRIPIIP